MLYKDMLFEDVFI